MMHRFTLLSAVLGLAFCITAVTADDKPETKEEFACKCPVSGADAKKEQHAKYKEKDVYFCCEKCKAAFEADSAKFATKANHQLVLTKQFHQTVCPLSGGKLNKDQSSKVEGVTVTFCCEKCKGAIDKSSKEDQVSKIFTEEVFTKAFAADDKPKEEFACKCPVSGADAKKEQHAKYKEKDVYFCCEKCKAAFEADSAKFATKANHQLVLTKQFHQTVCPLSGGKLNKDQSSKVEGVTVTFCCEKCKGAIDGSSKEDQVTKIFSEEAFAKAFSGKEESK